MTKREVQRCQRMRGVYGAVKRCVVVEGGGSMKYEVVKGMRRVREVRRVEDI